MKRHRKFKWRRFWPIQLAVYLALRWGMILLTLMRYRRARDFGLFLGNALYFFDGKHRSIALKNLERSNVSVPDPPAFLRRVYRHLGLSFVEMLTLPPRLKRDRERYITIEGLKEALTLLTHGKGAICVIAHLGNWEVGGIGVTLAGLPLHSIARPIENPYIDRYVNRLRTQTGQRIISKYGALRDTVNLLKAGGFVVFLSDQNARKGGVFVPFLGREASTIKSPAILSLKYGAPIVATNVFREPNGRHRVVIEAPLWPQAFRDKEDPIREITAAFTAQLEAFVRQHPDQWMWLHARWKTRPEDVGRGRRFTSKDYAPIDE